MLSLPPAPGFQDGEFDDLPGKSFKPGSAFTRVAVNGALPKTTNKILWVISGSFSQDVTRGTDTTYTEIQYDKAELKVNEARIEIIPEGILIYASPNNFLKLTRDGLELSGTTISADSISANTLSAVSTDVTGEAGTSGLAGESGDSGTDGT